MSQDWKAKWPVGSVVWSIDSSDETNGYDIHLEAGPREPWQGKVTDNGRGVLRLCSFNPDTGEVDDDSNACTTAPRHLFATRAEADAAYRIERKRHAARLLGQALEYIDWEPARLLVGAAIDSLTPKTA